MRKIVIKCKSHDSVCIDDLVDIQKSVKSLNPNEMEKMLKSFETLGFLDPFDVWKDKKKNQLILLGGNQRLKALKKARELGWKLPDQFPANMIEASNLKEARKMLLSMASTFGRTSKEALLDFSKKFAINIKEVASFSSFPEFNIMENEDETSNTNSQKDTNENQGGISVMRIPFFDHDIDNAQNLFESAYKKLKEAYPDTITCQSDAFIYIMQYINDNYKPDK